MKRNFIGRIVGSDIERLFDFILDGKDDKWYPCILLRHYSELNGSCRTVGLPQSMAKELRADVPWHFYYISYDACITWLPTSKMDFMREKQSNLDEAPAYFIDCIPLADSSLAQTEFCTVNDKMDKLKRFIDKVIRKCKPTAHL